MVTTGATTHHGGRLDEAVARFGGKRKSWLDLSTGINPNSYPVGDIPLSAWRDLPDLGAEQDAANAAKTAYKAPSDCGLSLASGTQMHIQLLPWLFKPQDVALVGFTYQEHSLCWKRAGHNVFVTDGLESAETTARIVIVVNPNNPDGRIVDRDNLIALSRRLAAKGGLLVVDESFADVAPLSSVAGEAGRDGLLVMRSLGKFYGLAGVRFGVALGSRSVTDRLNERLGPWAVSGPALALATKALGDTSWQKKTLKKLMAGREKLEELLVSLDFRVAGGTGLFVLCDTPNASELYDHLAKSRILVRPFPAKPNWLRFGLPANASGFKRLEKALSSFSSQA